MRTTFVIGDSLLTPGEDVAVGDLVIDPKNPHHGFFSSPKIMEAMVSITPKTNFKEKDADSSSYGLRGALTQLASASFKSSKKTSIDFCTAEESTYRLIDSDGWFEAILADDDTKKYLEKTIIQRGKDVLFVVGFRTIQDSNVSHTDAASAHLSGKLKVPASQLVAPGPAPPILQQMDPSVATSKDKQQQVQRSYIAPGEQVYAVEYRKISFNFFTKKNVDQAFLQDGSRWELFWSSRGQDEEDDIVEAKLIDVSELGNPIWQSGEDEQWVSLV